MHTCMNERTSNAQGEKFALGREVSGRDSERLCLLVWFLLSLYSVSFYLFAHFLFFITRSHTWGQWSPILEPLWFSGLRVSCPGLMACSMALQWHWSHSTESFPSEIWAEKRMRVKESKGWRWGPTCDWPTVWPWANSQHFRTLLWGLNVTM